MFRYRITGVLFNKNTILRYFSIKEDKMKAIKYTETINLPKTKFPARLSAAKRLEVETNINEKCFSGLYQWQRNHLPKEQDNSKEYVLHDGPPYANGDLHMGHAINKILKDIILRYNVINGRRVHYRPGWDCHGLPIELKSISSGGENEKPKTNPLEIRKLAREYAYQAIASQKKEFASWGIMADWNKTNEIYRTIDNDYICNELRLFYDMYDKKMVYRDLKPVYWSPSSKTALAEAELEYDPNYESSSLTFRLKMCKVSAEIKKIIAKAGVSSDQHIFALIWTTTPWSLPANQSVCFNPEFKYSLVQLTRGGADEEAIYIIATDLIPHLQEKVEKIVAKISGQHLIGSTYFHPIDRELELPFVIADHVKATKGTGLVHCAPAHGPEDFLVGLEHNMKMKCMVDDDGKYNKNAPDFLQSKIVLEEGTPLVIDYLDDDVIILEKLRHSYPIDWRTKKPILIRASDQWFINTEKIKESAISQLSHVTIHPQRTGEISKINLISQLRKRPYWCISRQRVWGTPIPVFYSIRTQKPIVDKELIEHLCNLLQQPNSSPDLWWSKSIAELVPTKILNRLGYSSPNELKKGNDILDIWFDSGISWSYALEKEKIADLYVEGIDQFTGWFQSSLMTSVACRDQSPYRSLFVHGFAVDDEGKKMSKSIGNVIYPHEIINKYGIDTLRWWVAYHATQHALIPVGPTTLQSSTECVQKIRSTLKYLVGFVQNNNHEIPFDKLKILDIYFLNSLTEFDKEITELYATHNYNRAAKTILNFVTNNMSSEYLHLIKDRLYCGTVEEYQVVESILNVAFQTLNKSIWPILPFLVEECWTYLNDTKPFYDEYLIGHKQQLLNDQRCKNITYNKTIDKCNEIKQLLHQSVLKTNSWTWNVVIQCDQYCADILKEIHPVFMQPINNSELCELLQVSSINLVPIVHLDKLTIEAKQIKGCLCPRCRRFAVLDSSTLCQRCDRVLNFK